MRGLDAAEFDARVKWITAFVKAQAAFPPVAKTKTANIPTKSGGSYSYKYADLGDIIDAVNPILHKHGFAVVQSTVTSDYGVGIVTVIAHEDGWLEEYGPLFLKPTGGDPQSAGSAVTYARRYALTAALGIATEEDDDGRTASRPAETQLSDDELAERGTNKLKAEALELMGDSDEAKAIYKQALARLSLEPDVVVPLDLQERVRDALKEMAP